MVSTKLKLCLTSQPRFLEISILHFRVVSSLGTGIRTIGSRWCSRRCWQTRTDKYHQYCSIGGSGSSGSKYILTSTISFYRSWLGETTISSLWVKLQGPILTHIEVRKSLWMPLLRPDSLSIIFEYKVNSHFDSYFSLSHTLICATPEDSRYIAVQHMGTIQTAVVFCYRFIPLCSSLWAISGTKS